MTETAILWNNVTFSVRSGFWMTPKTILHSITMSLYPGTVLGLVGPNGAGKTTTIKLAAGLLQPESGEVNIFGQPAYNAASRKSLGLLTETQYIYPHLRLREWLIMLAQISDMKPEIHEQRVKEVLKIVQLEDRANQMMKTFSKGQLQRAGLAQALVHDPQLLILDEPMSGLDPFWRYRFQNILLDLKSSGKTILFSSHILTDVERLSDQVALIENGRLQWMGDLSKLPRQINGYEAVCDTVDPEILEKLVSAQNMNRQPDGKWVVSISLEQREELLKLVVGDQITLLSLQPIQKEIEEVLFGFSSKSNQLT